MRIGIIGVGNMGRILAEAILDKKAVSPTSLTIANRTKIKALELKNKYEEITVVNNAKEVAKVSNLIFLCVKPLDMYGVIQDILPFLTIEKCVVSITSPVTVRQLNRVIPCSVARTIPSITNRASAGVSLITFGEHCTDEWKDRLQLLFQKISVPVEIEEKVTRVASDIVSCGPAFFSYLAQRFINAAVKETEIDNELAITLMSEMLIGMGELLKNQYYTLPTLQNKVSVKGGITGEGIKVLEEELGDIFEHLIQATHHKFNEDLDEINKQFP